MKNKPERVWAGITEEDAEWALKKAHNWKSPGIDKIPNFWLYSLNKAHKKLAKELQEMVNDPTKFPVWVTFLLFKNSDSNVPKNYRPITCLPTSYKLFTSILTKQTYSFLEKNDILPLEQKGCKRDSYRCKG